MQPTISVIIPAYQAAPYLQRCLDSLLAQTLRDIEIVVVDDGSTDGTPALMRTYVEKDSRIVSLRQENGGVSSARNRGLEQACGQWVAFVDVDDWAEAQYLSSLLPQEAGTDFVVSGHTEHRSKLTVPHQPATCGPLPLTQAASVIAALEADYHLNTPWAKLYCKDIIDRHGLRFDPAYSYGEDKLFVYRYLCHCATVQVTTGTYYHYNNQADGLSRKIHPPRIIWKWNEEMLDTMSQAGTTFGWPPQVTEAMRSRSFTYFTLYMADSIYHQPLRGRERRSLLSEVYARRRSQRLFSLHHCTGKTQLLAALLYKTNSTALSHTVYTLLCGRGGKGMMR